MTEGLASILVDLPVDARQLVERLQAENRALRQEVDRLSVYRHLAFRDDLTGLYNRRHFTERMAQEWSRASRYDEPLALVLMDLDSFKQINDTTGHATGDYALSFVGRHMTAQCRQSRR
jgi:PleD family two-component response regulator